VFLRIRHSQSYWFRAHTARAARRDSGEAAQTIYCWSLCHQSLLICQTRSHMPSTFSFSRTLKCVRRTLPTEATSADLDRATSTKDSSSHSTARTPGTDLDQAPCSQRQASVHAEQGGCLRSWQQPLVLFACSPPCKLAASRTGAGVLHLARSAVAVVKGNCLTELPSCCLLPILMTYQSPG
jgi:hypothetical protein